MKRNQLPLVLDCVCQPLFQRGTNYSSFQHNTAGSHGSIHQSVANEATDVWRGYAVWSTARTCHVIPTSLFHPRVQAVAGHRRSFMQCWVKQYCFADSSPFRSSSMTESALQLSTWIPSSIYQACDCRSISESHKLARLPVWSSWVKALYCSRLIPSLQVRISYPLSLG